MEAKTSDSDARTLCLDTLFCDECEATVYYAMQCADCDMSYCEECDRSFHQGEFSQHSRVGVLHDPEALASMDKLKQALQEADTELVREQEQLMQQAMAEAAAEEALLQALAAGQTLSPEQLASLSKAVEDQGELPPLPDDDSDMEDR